MPGWPAQDWLTAIARGFVMIGMTAAMLGSLIIILTAMGLLAGGESRQARKEYLREQYLVKTKAGGTRYRT
jgi:hypothetical protein